MAAKKKPAVSKQEQAQAKRGGTQPSGKKWYLSPPNKSGEQDRGTYKPGSQPKGWKPASKSAATRLGAFAARDTWYKGLPGAPRGRSIAAKRAAAPAPRIAKKQAERSGPTRAVIRVKKK